MEYEYDTLEVFSECSLSILCCFIIFYKNCLSCDKVLGINDVASFVSPLVEGYVHHLVHFALKAGHGKAIFDLNLGSIVYL